mgnify:CR=1 FL=1
MMLVLTSLLLIYIRQSILLTRASYELLCKAIPEPIAHLLREGQTVRYAVRSAVVVFGDIEGTSCGQPSTKPTVLHLR